MQPYVGMLIPSISWCLLLALLIGSGCGLIPERVAQDDPRMEPMLAAIARVSRRAMGFTPIPPGAEIRVEWGPRHNYDVMLDITARMFRTIGFKRTSV